MSAKNKKIPNNELKMTSKPFILAVLNSSYCGVGWNITEQAIFP